MILLAREFLARIRLDLGRPEIRLSAAAERALVGHGWPGNVRELRNVLEHAALLRARHARPHDVAGVSAQPGRRASGERRAACPSPTSRGVRREGLEREGWAADRAARALGISRTTLYERMRSTAFWTPRG